jgi:L-fucose isomerase-like protein
VTNTTAARLAVLSPYWDFWEHTVGPALRVERRADAESLARSLADSGEVVGVVQAASPVEAEQAAAGLGPVDVVVVHAAMAVPPRTVTAFVGALEPSPLVVVFAANSAGFAVTDDFDHGDITRHGATVGAPMVVGALRRAGTEPLVVLGRLGDGATLARLRTAVRRAGAAARLRRARVGVIGGPLPGYDHVVTDAGRLRARLGVTLVPIAPAEVTAAYEAVGPERLQPLYLELSDRFRLAEGAEGESLERTLRAAVAIEELCATHGLDGGAMNCHVPEIRLGGPIGIAPCYGIGRMTSRRVPFTCVGDVMTAVAMVAVAGLGRPTLYHELEALDYRSGELVVANSGEHDDRFWPPPARPTLRRNAWFLVQDGLRSLCVEGVLDPGPATLVNLTEGPDGGYCFVTARGELTGRGFAGSGTTNGGFRFSAPDAVTAWEAWAAAGPGHHSCLTTGDADADIATIARHLGATHQAVC